ncbi:MAG: hypothetical protein CSA11_03275 [Chloroflexi bacterium]|nr:MAG: hypothetical protein CSA11_03275 [Chloroflexota bacterium]
MITFRQVSYGGWSNCYKLSNDLVDLVITADVGPRIIRFGFVGAENEFGELPEVGQTGGDDWTLYGGHRLWHAPENKARTYYPDNHPIQVEEHPGFIRAIQPVESTTGIQKEIDLYLDENGAQVTVVHRLINQNLWWLELAPWALSVMTAGGVGIAPMPPKGSHRENILPTGSMALWAYTDMTDPRWVWGNEFIMLNQNAAMPAPQKIGVWVPNGWAAYARRGHLFVKTFAPGKQSDYPDFGSNVEFFTNDEILEVETLGSLAKLAPGTAVTHTETWYLFDNIRQPQTETDIIEEIMPVVNTII